MTDNRVDQAYLGYLFSPLCMTRKKRMQVGWRRRKSLFNLLYFRFGHPENKIRKITSDSNQIGFWKQIKNFSVALPHLSWL